VNRRRITIGLSSLSGVAVVTAGAMSMFSSGGSANAVDLHSTPLAAVTGSGAATRQAGSAQADTTETIASPAAPAQGSTPAVPAQTQSVHGSGLFDFTKRAGQVDLTMANGGMQEVLTPTTVWVRSTSQGATPSAKNWTGMSTDKMSDGNVVTGGATDPDLVFAMLGGTQPDVRYIGQDQVRGVPVAHYQGTLDLQQAAAALPATTPAVATAAETDTGMGNTPIADAAAKKALSNAAQEFTTPKVPFDVYLDAQGRVRRFVGTFSIAKGPNKQVAQVTSATELFGFGTPVTVVTPSVAPTQNVAPAASGTAGAKGAKGATSANPDSTAAKGEAGHHSTTPSEHSPSPGRAHK